MKIDRIESWREEVPLARPYAIAQHRFDSVTLFVLRLTSDDGRVGLGAASPAGFVTGETRAACGEALAVESLSDLLGADPRRPSPLARRVDAARGAAPAARAAIDMALWDLCGHGLGKPIVDLLGRCHESLPTSVTLGIAPLAETLADAAEWVGRGFRHLKVKLGEDVESDLERLSKLRERYADRVELRVDVNQGYDSRQVGRLLNAADELALELIEQPLARGADGALGELRPPGTKVPLAADESLHDARDALVEAEEGSPYAIFNIKLMKCGGIGPARAISAVADAASRDLMWGSMDESRISIAAALHTAYACPRTRYLDLDGSFDLARDPAAGGFEVRAGRMYLSPAPGLGVRLRSDG